MTLTIPNDNTIYRYSITLEESSYYMNSMPIWATFAGFVYCYFPFEFKPLVYRRNFLRSNIIITNVTINSMTTSLLCIRDDYVRFMDKFSWRLSVTHYERDIAPWPLVDTNLMDRKSMTAFHTYQLYQYLNLRRECMKYHE